MKRPLKILLALVATFLVLFVTAYLVLVIRFKPDEQGRIVPWGENIDLSSLPVFRNSLKAPREFVILEGLPHQGWESDLLKEEIAAKETIKIHGFHFYSHPLPPSEQDRIALIESMTQEGGIEEWAGMKLCGGYHPDYALQWRDSEGEWFEALICFGCHEIKLYGEGVQLYADLGEESYEELKKTLLPYGDQRPKREGKN